MSRHGFSFPKVEGKSSQQAHVGIPDGHYEREIGREGFFGPATHMIHAHPPTSWSNWEGPLKPRAFRLDELNHESSSPWGATTGLSNQDVKIRWWGLREDMKHLVRNGDGDELLFVHEGEGELYCDYGHMSFSKGDYVLLPRGCMWRLTTQQRCRILMMEASGGSYQLPDRGPLGQHAVYDPAKLETPKLDADFIHQQTDTPWDVVIKRRDRLSTVTFPHNPLDAVGWHGNLSAMRINWRDLRPVMSHRYHLPPSAHTTFVAPGFVVCTFAPRPLETDRDALKLPFFHSNDDYDEVLFYHQGSFISRDNVGPGMMSLHPAGFAHGPHPTAFSRASSGDRTMTDEVAVMIDTREALDINDALNTTEWCEYVNSWKGELK
jgi:homogentisate 1,2-dioxygenase